MTDDKKFDRICFCCLTQEGNLKTMLDECFISESVKIQLTEGYTACAGIVLDDELPKKICVACEEKLKSSYDFRELCRASYRILKERNNFIPALYVDVKHEQQSEDENDLDLVYNNSFTEMTNSEPPPLSKVFIKSERITLTTKSKKKYKKKVKTTLGEPADGVEASDLESDFWCFHCDIVLPTHREYLKHYERHRNGKGYKRIHRVCQICQEETKIFTRHIFDKHKDYKPFKCKYCSKGYQTPGNLRTHLTAHVVGEAKHECRTCGEKFKRNNILRSHIFSHKNPNNYYFCPFCGETFTEFSNLYQHFVQSHDPNKTKNLYPCFSCKRIFMVRKNFDDHECVSLRKIAKMEVESAVPCARCADIFRSQDEFICHQFLGCRDTDPHVCRTCNKTFLTKNKLQIHLSHAHWAKPKTFVCEICGHGSVDDDKYQIHKSSHETERKLKCQHPGCKAAFKHIRYLRNHEKLHEEKLYECDHCKKRFLNYTSIKIHMATHSDSSELRRFACELCGKRTATSGALTTHMVSHSGAKTVSCPACPRLFLHHSNAKMHYRITHEGTYWQCKFCDSNYQSPSGLREHLFVHRGFHPYNCTMCQAHFNHSTKFKQHLWNQHQTVYDTEVHGYIEKDDLRALINECERKKDTNPPNTSLRFAASGKVKIEANESQGYKIVDVQTVFKKNK